MNRVLVIYYSQSGDVAGAVESFVKFLDSPEVEIIWEQIRPEVDFPYPWGIHSFFDVFPECVLEEPPEIHPVSLFDPDERFDLVILAYQVWFLAPSLPIQGFLKSEYAKVLKDTKVITLVVSRNMWHSASETVKKMIANIGGIHIDNVVVTYQGPAWATFITTLWLMFTGKRKVLGGLLPPAGISEKDLEALSGFGKVIANNLSALRVDSNQSLLRGLGAVKVDTRIVIPELLGRSSFKRWARIIQAFGKPGSWRRRPIMYLFMVSLGLSVLLSIPLGMILHPLVYPLIQKRIAGYVHRLKSPSGINLE